MNKIPVRIKCKFTGYYVDSNGVVYGKRGRALKPYLGKNTSPGRWNAYPVVPFYDRASSKTTLIFLHQIIANAWLDKPKVGKYEIDHIDRNRLNNHPNNLRWVTHAQNMCNRKGLNKNVGVGFVRKTGKWQARIMSNNVSYGKCFDTEVEAIAHRAILELRHR